jgi:hypothetical protein
LDADAELLMLGSTCLILDSWYKKTSDNIAYNFNPVTSRGKILKSEFAPQSSSPAL